MHGPAYSREAFPEHLGDHHVDDTPTILEELEALLARDDRVRSLLGNHEHGHIGGPHTQKFHQRPDEVEVLEARLGPARKARALALFRSFALAALTPCGVLFLHAAPAARAAGFAEVAAARLDGHERLRVREMCEVPVVGELLWAKHASPDVAAAFLARMAFEDMEPRLAVYGHDIVADGFDVVADNQVIVSTSFGVVRARKTLCEIDMAASYASAADLRSGFELYPLYSQFSPAAR